MLDIKEGGNMKEDGVMLVEVDSFSLGEETKKESE